MLQYVYTNAGKTAIQCSDGRTIPVCPGNLDYDALIAEGTAISDYVIPLPILAEVQTAKRVEINAGFDAALTASLTMPSRNTPPSAVELAIAAADFKVDDPTGLADLLAIHEARRASLLSAVDAATTVAEVQAITVSYAV